MYGVLGWLIKLFPFQLQGHDKMSYGGSMIVMNQHNAPDKQSQNTVHMNFKVENVCLN